MPTINTARLRGIVMLAGVAVVTAAIGFATTAQLAARPGRSAGQDPAVQGGGRGPGPMGLGRMGPGGPGMRGGPGGPFGMAGLPLGELNLTDTELDQVKAVVESHRVEQQAIGERMQAARRALQDAITADTFDEAAIRAAVAQSGAVEADAAVLQAKIRAEILALLTPEQAQKAKDLRLQMENRMQMEGDRGRGRGMRPHPLQTPRPSAEDHIGLPENA